MVLNHNIKKDNRQILINRNQLFNLTYFEFFINLKK
jgi:hypothetical protein